MIFEQIRVGGDRNFAYLIGDEASKEGAVVDPSYNPTLVLERCATHGLEVKYLINTHGHIDHTNGNDHVMAQISPAFLAWDQPNAGDGQTLSLGEVELTFLHTPGHTEDSLCVLARQAGTPGKLVTGDTLFVGKVGGTDLGEGARLEYDSLHKKVMTLPDDTEVWPGHDYGVAPDSTIGHERKTNPFLLRDTFESFVDLKRNWAEYKKEHGIQ